MMQTRSFMAIGLGDHVATDAGNERDGGGGLLASSDEDDVDEHDPDDFSEEEASDQVPAAFRVLAVPMSLEQNLVFSISGSRWYATFSFQARPGIDHESVWCMSGSHLSQCLKSIRQMIHAGRTRAGGTAPAHAAGCGRQCTQAEAPGNSHHRGAARV